jgi:hypothetical protein
LHQPPFSKPRLRQKHQHPPPLCAPSCPISRAVAPTNCRRQRQRRTLTLRAIAWRRGTWASWLCEATGDAPERGVPRAVFGVKLGTAGARCGNESSAWSNEGGGLGAEGQRQLRTGTDTYRLDFNLLNTHN